MSGPELRLRDAARAVILDPAGRILLVRFEFPGRWLWACPGGGLELGESHEAALRRELREEVGLDLDDLGPCVWTRTHVIPLFGGRWDGQVERFFLVQVEPFEPAPLLTPEQLRAEYISDVRGGRLRSWPARPSCMRRDAFPSLSRPCERRVRPRSRSTPGCEALHDHVTR